MTKNPILSNQNVSFYNALKKISLKTENSARQRAELKIEHIILVYRYSTRQCLLDIVLHLIEQVLEAEKIIEQ